MYVVWLKNTTTIGSMLFARSCAMTTFVGISVWERVTKGEFGKNALRQHNLPNLRHGNRQHPFDKNAAWAVRCIGLVRRDYGQENFTRQPLHYQPIELPRLKVLLVVYFRTTSECQLLVITKILKENLDNWTAFD